MCVHTRVCAYTCVCVYVCVRAHTCERMHVCACTYVSCMCLCMCVVFVNVYVCIPTEYNRNAPCTVKLTPPTPPTPNLYHIYITYYRHEYRDQITITLASLTITTVSKTKDQPQSATVGHPCPWQVVSDHESLQQGPVFVSGLPQSGPAALALLNCWFLAAFGGGLCKPEALLLSSGQPWWGNQIFNWQKCGIPDLIRVGSLEHKCCKTPSACCLAWCGF